MSAGLKRLSVCLLAFAFAVLLTGSAHAGLLFQYNSVVTSPGALGPFSHACPGSHGGALEIFDNPDFTAADCGSIGTDIVLTNLKVHSSSATDETLNCGLSLNLALHENTSGA